MRPRSLQLKGFTVFRDMTEPVSFEDADLFALTGPTGSGKTSILDAMCFALYGRVPRLDARAVEPVISLGAPEARIIFEFSAGGDVYRAARVVRRTKSGATTPEARLEIVMADETSVVLASGADEVNETAAQLIGLSFDHFTKTVLLPQGAFAAFLHDTPAKRQDLLRTLLDLGVYERMREMAQHRKSRAEGEAAALERDVERLATATEDAERASEQRVADLRETADALRALQPDIVQVAGDIEEIGAERANALVTIERLAAVVVPDEVADLAGERRVSEERLEAARTSAREAGDRVVESEKRLASMPDVAELTSAIGDWERRRGLETRRVRGIETTNDARSRQTQAIHKEEQARAADDEARAALRALETRHAGAALATHLEIGDECPVCLRTVEELPEHPRLPGLDDARNHVEQASGALTAARQEVAAASSHLGSCVDTLAAVEREIGELDERLEGRPAEEAARAALVEIRAATEELKALREVERTAAAETEVARKQLDEIMERERLARRDLSVARDRFAAAGPPELEMSDLESDWRRLVAWSAERADEMASFAGELEERLVALRATRSEQQRRIAELVGPWGVDETETNPGERLAALVTEAEIRHAAIVRDRQAAAEKATSLAAVKRESEVAKALALHLQASRFEGWLMEEALVGLVAGANALLGQLSSGAYSLEMAKRDFVVIDHRNADETRGVKTLSGGETFLVSLALALSLAEQIGGMAAGGGARLESIFLDEGFGTLDSDTLDVVAAVIQELGASGRTVGIVTHVTELAELVPTRFEVVRGVGGSAVNRVDT